MKPGPRFIILARDEVHRQDPPAAEAMKPMRAVRREDFGATRVAREPAQVAREGSAR